MRDYDATVKNLREAAKGLLFDAMPYRASVMNDAADAIEEQSKRADELGEELTSAMELVHKRNEKIEKLQSELVTTRNQLPRWISVEERLPEGNGTRYEYDLEESNLVLVYGINHIGEMAYGLGRYIYDHDDPKDSGWNGNMDCDYDLDYCTVTHWMPLPEPPKGGNHDN